MNTFIGILIGILFLSLMMFIHEYGHYLMGKCLGFKILAFNIFMGPEIFGWTKNGVRYSLRAIPLGASVQFAGESEEENGMTAKSRDEDEGSWDKAASESASAPGDAVSAPTEHRGSTRSPSGKRATRGSRWADFNTPPITGTDDPRLFFNRPKWRRAVVLLSGPFFNILSGILAYIIIFTSIGYALPVIAQAGEDGQAAQAGLRPGDRIVELNGNGVNTSLDWQFVLSFAKPNQTLNVKYRRDNGPVQTAVLSPKLHDAYQLGIERSPREPGLVQVKGVNPQSNNGQPVLRPGDIILEIGGEKCTNGNIASLISASQGKPLTLKIERDGLNKVLTTTPIKVAEPNPVGMAFTPKNGFWGAIPYSYQYYGSIVRVTFVSLGMLFRGSIPAKDAVSGPVGVVNMFSGVVTERTAPISDKLIELLQLFALISISLGIMNLLPIPLLDGAHLWLLLLEAIRGKRLGAKAQGAFAAVGLVMILALFVLGLYFDISRLVG